MNVLLTCAGRRNYLVHAFREAVGPRGRVFVADARADASALGEADAGFVLPPVADVEYLDRLLALCREQSVGLLVPLNDHELPLLAAHRARFRAIGTRVVVAAPSVVAMCADKWATYTFLRARGIPTARTYRTFADARAALVCGEISFPLVLKPRWGSGSVGVEYVHDADELALAHALAVRRMARGEKAEGRRRNAEGEMRSGNPNCVLPSPFLSSAFSPEEAILIQARLTGAEHGLDVVNDLAGQYVAVFAKRKTMMRSGETDRATVIADAPFASLAAALGGAVGHVGNLDCDCFVGNDGVISVLEFNPRFGGGYPFAHAAGANLPAALVAWVRGAEPDPAWFHVTPGATMAKCDRVVVVNRASGGTSACEGMAGDIAASDDIPAMFAATA